MGYKSLRDCIADLEKHGHLIRIKEEVDPYLEMAAIHMRVFDAGGPALFFENVKGSAFPAVSNLFGTLERSAFMFRDSMNAVKQLVSLRSDPVKALKNPLKYAGSAANAVSALPLRMRFSRTPFRETTVSALPQIVNWPMDGGPFVTMPQVYTEDPDQRGIMHANLGMYRIQLAGNSYIQDREIGLHYQIHRGIGVHQSKANAKGQPLKVSIFVGGPPSHPLAAVMPLPEGLSEMTFAGALGNRRFRYFYDKEGFCLSADADFVITGTVYPGDTKPEGPFGDHLGYYSLVHPFPLMKVHKVYHRKDAVWSFTVVGRPPQEDTAFGALIHQITGAAMPKEINGLKEVHAVDAAGVHPLLFAIGSERYTPYLDERKPQEILTISNHILGKNQLSLAKYLFIAAREDDETLSTHHIEQFLSHVFERLDLSRDLHFHTNTTIDTLDYTGTGLNSGSKLVLAAAGRPKRQLATEVPAGLTGAMANVKLALPGVLAVQAPAYSGSETTEDYVNALDRDFPERLRDGVVLLVLCDDADFTAANTANFVWITFTRSNPAADVHGIGAVTRNKHWGCTGPLIIDARRKPHHAPELIKDPKIEARVDNLGAKGKSLYGII
ncbi:UbiD family decarboxylase [Pedobacter sp. SYP-B3415]|uniref:UbiD family decarboxylase n=1 Tax=Pedobacter sp. SYP-B3415 TaxID=2496641 RepID=UPI00101C9932|nr:UbiD family decarboxylase [Pedobacter sp. SYP-B3415]